MNQKFIFVALSAILFTGCSLPGKPAAQTSANETSQTQNQQNKEGKTEAGFSIKDALTVGQSTKCTYKDGDTQVTTYIKDKKVRVDSFVSDPDKKTPQTGGMINDGEWMYFWDSSEATSGLKYQLSKMEEAAKQWADNTDDSKQEASEFSDPQKWADDIQNKHDISCKAEIITDSLFTPPAAITFQDMSALLDMAKQFGQDTQNDNPAVNQEELMKTYQNLIPLQSENENIQGNEE